MESIKALHSRVSEGRLAAPAPTSEQLKNIQLAAFRAADHGRIKPWRFLVIEGDGLHALGELFVAAAEAGGDELSDKERQRIVAKPMRAPMIIVAIARCSDHPKVPEVEQIISAGAAVQNMLNAAFVQGVGAMWRTGGFAYDRAIMEGLGLAERESIVGFLYLGTSSGRDRQPPELTIGDFFSNWPG